MALDDHLRLVSHLIMHQCVKDVLTQICKGCFGWSVRCQNMVYTYVSEHGLHFTYFSLG